MQRNCSHRSDRPAGSKGIDGWYGYGSACADAVQSRAHNRARHAVPLSIIGGPLQTPVQSLETPASPEQRRRSIARAGLSLSFFLYRPDRPHALPCHATARELYQLSPSPARPPRARSRQAHAKGKQAPARPYPSHACRCTRGSTYVRTGRPGPDHCTHQSYIAL